jgi:hypothetical protein
MAGKRKITWQLNDDVKFVFYVDRFGYIKKAQMKNLAGWGYIEFEKKAQLG